MLYPIVILAYYYSFDPYAVCHLRFAYISWRTGATALPSTIYTPGILYYCVTSVIISWPSLFFYCCLFPRLHVPPLTRVVRTDNDAGNIMLQCTRCDLAKLAAKVHGAQPQVISRCMFCNLFINAIRRRVSFDVVSGLRFVLSRPMNSQ